MTQNHFNYANDPFVWRKGARHLRFRADLYSLSYISVKLSNMNGMTTGNKCRHLLNVAAASITYT